MTTPDINTDNYDNQDWHPPSLESFTLLSDEMLPAERNALLLLDRRLHSAWGLGANVILGWSPARDHIDILVVPHYALAEFAAPEAAFEAPHRPSVSINFLQTLISGSRKLSGQELAKVARMLEIEPQRIDLALALSSTAAQQDIIDRMVNRYSISYVPCRAVALLDIVGFSLLSPFEQVAQLNSLAYSLNAAHSRMIHRQLGVNFARSSTGDGFYIWNRDTGLAANTNLYHFMHLVLADNAIARRKASANSVPLLRVGFHVGGCYEFHQAEGLNPTLYNYIVGDVTIALARMIDSALPGQIFVGDFQVEMPQAADDGHEVVKLDAVTFMRLAQQNLAKLNGIKLSGDCIEAIKCYLTGERLASGQYTIRRLTIVDKHNLSHNVFNAKVNIYRRNAEPILLGLEDRVLTMTGAPDEPHATGQTPVTGP